MTSGKGAKKPSDKTMMKVAGPWQPLQDPLRNQINNAKIVTGQPYQYGPDRVAPMDPAQSWGVARGSDIAMNGQGVTELNNAFGNVANLAAGNLSGAGTAYMDRIATQGAGRGAGAAYMDQIALHGGGRGAGAAYMDKIAKQGGGRGAGAAYMDKIAKQGGGRGAGAAYMDKIAKQGGGRGAGAAFMDQIAKKGISNPAFEDLQSVLTAANAGSPAAAALAKYAQEAGGGSGGIEYLRDVVKGKYLGKNPYIDKLVADVERDANNALLPSLEGRMSQAGRLGSNAETMGQGEIAKQLASKSNEIRYTDYNNERGMQQQAGLALPGAFNTEIGTKVNAANSQADDHYRALDERLQAAQAVGSDVYQREGIQMNASQIANADHQAVVNQQLNAAGMSDADHQAAVAQQLGAAGMADADHQAAVAQQLGAAGMADSDHQAAVAQQLGAAGMANADWRATVDQQLGAANMSNNSKLAFNNQSLSAANQLPGQYQSLFAPADRALQYGGVNQAQDQAQRGEAADRFQFNQTEPYNQLQRRLGLFQGINGMTNPGAAGQIYAQGASGPSGGQVALGNTMGILGTAANIGSMFMGPAGLPLTAASMAAGQIGRTYGGNQGQRAGF